MLSLLTSTPTSAGLWQDREPIMLAANNVALTGEIPGYPACC